MNKKYYGKKVHEIMVDSEQLNKSKSQFASDGSNWRLMVEGVSYRLGYLSGRLKGFEREEDLVQLIKQEKSK